MATATKAQAQRPARVAASVDVTGHGAATAVNVGTAHRDHEGWNDQLRETFGTTSNPFVDISMSRLEVVERDRGEAYAPERRLNGALALMGAIAPGDELEAALAQQIVAAHGLSMHLMGKAKHTDIMDKLQTFTNLATKVSRTMGRTGRNSRQLRSGGKQQVEVRYVYVQGNAMFGDHGQAVFAAPGGGDRLAFDPQPHEPGLSAIHGAALRSEDARRLALPAGQDAGSEALRLARGKSPGAPKGKANGRYSTGLRTREVLELRRQVRALVAEGRRLNDG